MRLSVLDQTPVPEGVSRPQALQNTIDLARLADRLGYHRYWLAEHHGLALAGPAPEVLAGPVAAATERIRVGNSYRRYLQAIARLKHGVSVEQAQAQAQGLATVPPE